MEKQAIQTPEAVFSSAIESLKKGSVSYTTPSWIENDGVYFYPRIDPNSGRETIYFDPNAYDPRRPYVPRGETYVLASNPEWILESPFDLDNLRLIEKEDVIDVLLKLEEQIRKPEEMEKDAVIVIGTGGTIAMKENESGLLEPGLDIDQLLQKTGQGITDRFSVASIQFPTLIDSSQMEVDYNAELTIAMSWIWDNASDALKERFAGFLVAHGTDTMAGSSAYQAMMLGPDCPFSVGYLGAQKTTKDRRTDAFANVKLAFDTLEDFRDHGITERFVAMGGTAGGAYPAVGVDKVSDRLVTAFKSLAHPVIVESEDFGEKGVIDPFTEEYKKEKTKSIESVRQQTSKEFWPIILRGYSHVLSIQPKEGQDPQIYYDMIKNNKDAKFVVLTTFGAFTANHKIRKAILKAAEETGKKVIANNPFPEGSTQHPYKDAEELRQSGVYVTGVLHIALEAKVLLGMRLFGDNTEKILDFVINTNFVGEQPPSYWKAYIEELQQKEQEQKVKIGYPQDGIKILYRRKISQVA